MFVKNYESKPCLLIDISVPTNYNIFIKEYNKKNK